MPAAPPSAAPKPVHDPRALMRIRSLELRARVVVEGFWKGLHRSPYHGFSVEFSEYRDYIPGDDLRYLDWKLYGRSDRYFIKKFEEETNLRCHLVADTSRSMDYGSIGHTKAQYAQTLAATLAYFLQAQGDAVGVLTFAGDAAEHIPARHRPGHLRAVMLALERAGAEGGTDLDAPLRRIGELVRKRGLIVLISDLLAPADTLKKRLGTLTAFGHEVFVFHVLDPAELSFDFPEPALFHDLESGRDMIVDPEAARASYLEQLGAHNEAITRACRKLGVAYRRFATDQPLELALFEFLAERTRARVRQRRGR